MCLNGTSPIPARNIALSHDSLNIVLVRLYAEVRRSTQITASPRMLSYEGESVNLNVEDSARAVE